MTELQRSHCQSAAQSDFATSARQLPATSLIAVFILHSFNQHYISRRRCLWVFFYINMYGNTHITFLWLVVEIINTNLTSGQILVQIQGSEFQQGAPTSKRQISLRFSALSKLCLLYLFNLGLCQFGRKHLKQSSCFEFVTVELLIWLEEVSLSNNSWSI